MVTLVVVVFHWPVVEQEQVFVVPIEQSIRNQLRLISAVQSRIMWALNNEHQTIEGIIEYTFWIFTHGLKIIRVCTRSAQDHSTDSIGWTTNSLNDKTKSSNNRLNQSLGFYLT